MRLSVNLIGGGRYWLAGEDVPDEDVPVHLHRYAEVKEAGQGDVPKPAPSAAGPKPKAHQMGRAALQRVGPLPWTPGQSKKACSAQQ